MSDVERARRTVTQFPPGMRVRHAGEQWPEAFRTGTGRVEEAFIVQGVHVEVKVRKDDGTLHQWSAWTVKPVGDREIDSEECAAIVGVAPGSWTAYVRAGRPVHRPAPQPVRRVGRTPLWSEQAVRAWQAARPGQGARLDLPAKAGESR